jgi:hypothetical protein
MFPTPLFALPTNSSDIAVLASAAFPDGWTTRDVVNADTPTAIDARTNGRVRKRDFISQKIEE